MTETFTLDEITALDSVMAESIEPVAPPSFLKERILSVVRDMPQNSRTVRANEGRWKALPIPGVKMKMLSVDEERGTATVLMALDPGTHVPKHDHHGAEDSFVISGSCRIGSLALRQGDFHHADADTHHGEIVSDEGCLLLLVVDREDCQAA